MKLLFLSCRRGEGEKGRRGEGEMGRWGDKTRI
jgi:hypothetical protein